MKIIFKKNREASLLFCLLITLSCMNFLGRGSIVYFVFALFALLKIHPFIKIDGNFIFAALLTMSIAISSIIFYNVNEFVKSLNYVLLYLIGYNGFISSENKLMFAKRSIFAIFAGFSLNIILTYWFNHEYNFEGRRLLYSIWTKEFMAVTLVGLLSSIIIGYSFYAIFLCKKYLIKLTGIVSIFVMFLINIQTATRTPIILFAIVYAFLFFLRFFSTNWRKKIKWLALSSIVVLVAIALYLNNAFGIRAYIISSPIFTRFSSEGIETSRTEIAVYHFNNMLDSLWGGNKISETYGKMAHNFIQEGHDKYGIFATIALLGLTYYFFRNIIRLLFVKEKQQIDYLFISMYVAIIIQICLEPVFDGYPVVVMSLLMIHGIVTAYLPIRDALIRGDDI